MDDRTREELDRLHALVRRLMQHPEYRLCFSLPGMIELWEPMTQNDADYSIVAIDMNQFHALNKLGRSRANEMVRVWLRSMRQSDLIGAAGDEFFIIVPTTEVRQVTDRLPQALFDAGLHATIVVVLADKRQALEPQLEASQDIITKAKIATQVSLWQPWKLNEREREYRLGPSVFIDYQLEVVSA